MAKLILFDVDKTLLVDSKDISEYVAESLRNIYGMVVSVNLNDYEGDTSQNIAEAVLRAAGMEEKEIKSRLNRYMEDVFYTYYNVAGHDKLKVHDGSAELLSDLEKRGMLIGIATGEGERIVKFKVEKAGLDKLFKIGGYGNNGKEMKDIIGFAINKAAEEHEFEKQSIFVVGSSPYAIKAAKELGLYAIAIADGKYSVDDLKAANPDVVVKSPKDKGKIISFVESH